MIQNLGDLLASVASADHSEISDIFGIENVDLKIDVDLGSTAVSGFIQPSRSIYMYVSTLILGINLESA